MSALSLYRNRYFLILIFCGNCLLPLFGQPDDSSVIAFETDSLKQELSRTSDPRIQIPILSRLSELNSQKPEEVAWLQQWYEVATRIDSIPAIYQALTNLARYYYNLYERRDSILYWGNKIDSIARSRNEYPEALFDAKSYSCQDLLWSHEYELALNEALNEYRLASELENHYGLFRCSESLGLIYQSIRRDSDAVVAFQESIDMLNNVNCLEAVKVEAIMRNSAYQSESALRSMPAERTAGILEHYKKSIADLADFNQRTGSVIAYKRDYWLLYCFYTDFYLQKNEPDKARLALDSATVYVGNIVVDGDYVQDTYLAARAHYYKKIGDLPLALTLIDSVLMNKRIPDDLLFKIDILKEQGRLNEALTLYDEIFELKSQRNKETFFRQINQLRTLHDLNNQEKQAHEMTLNNQRMARKQQLLIFFSFVLLILVLLLYILFRYYQRVSRLKNELLAEKRSLLESENRLTSEKEKAEEASRMKSAFVANMSHEIRTPLNAIVGFSGLLVEPSTEVEEREEYSSVIHNNTELLLNLINDVLDLSRMEAGDLKFKLDHYALLECCEKALYSVHPRVPKGVVLTFNPCPEPVILYTDILRLQQLLTNLLTNAIKFTPEGEINLSCEMINEGRQVRIAVTDTGAGIPLDKQADVFKRFEKLDNYKSGAGLGLSICSLIAQRLGGSISIDPAYTGGARFVFIHPCEVPS